MRSLEKKVLEIKEKEMNGKKIPLKFSTPAVNKVNKPKEEILSQNINQPTLFLKDFEAESYHKSLTNLPKKTNGSNELKGIAISKKDSPAFMYLSFLSFFYFSKFPT